MSPARRNVPYSSRPNHAARAAHAQAKRQFKTYDTSYIQPKKSKGPLIGAGIAAVVVVILLVLAVMFLMKSCAPAEASLPEGETAVVVIEEGSGANAIGDELQEAGLVGSSADFSNRVKEMGVDNQLKPGEYTFTGGMTVDELIEAIIAGPAVLGDALTIPEGYTLDDIAASVEQVTSGRITAAEFTEAASDASVYAGSYAFLADVGTNSLEGFLFPKTYGIQEDATADSVIRMMLDQYQVEVASLDYSYPESQGLNTYQTLILASIIEKESPDNAEVRAKVAAVFYNRLANEGAPTYGLLGSDATTAYEIGEDPTDYDWSTDSLYNTRVHKGLTPTPICSPSLDSIKAACSPAENMEDYYFFSFWPNEEGVVEYFFDKTYEEHQATIAEHA